MGRHTPGALLADATWCGTLAASRSLCANDVPVTLACDSMMAPARWSRCVAQVQSCPPTKDANRFLEWLLQFGARNPGHVLYPTSDETAWLLSAKSEALSRFYRLYSPPIRALARILDKAALSEEARTAGLEVPECRFPQSEAELAGHADEIGFPIYVKPRAQVFGTGLGKGARAANIDELRSSWLAQRDRSSYAPDVAHAMPGVQLPMLQRAASGSERIYTVDGFIDATGELYVTLACVKLLQRPRGSGPGIIFEHAECIPEIDAGLKRLFLNTGFYGVFDAEFLEHDGRLVLVDINPRYYNHMAFEIERGLPLPWLAYLAAIGDWEALRREIGQAKHNLSKRGHYVHRLPTALLLAAQRFTGAMPSVDQARWRGCLKDRDASITEPVRSSRDPVPALAEVALEAVAFARHPRAYLRGLTR
jgi:D-aspartate ligase